MKKYILVVIIIALSISGATAQKWALPGAKWDYRYNWFQSFSSPSLSVLKDTTVIGVSCKQIGGYGNKMWYTYESNDTVFFYVGGKFYPTYYFNANAGDTLSFYTNRETICSLDTILYAVVDSITSINQQSSTPLKRYNLTWLNYTVLGQAGIYNDFYIERLGFQSYIYPYFHCFIDDEVYVLCSYSDSDLAQSVDNIFCTTAISKTTQSANVLVSPNPTNNVFSAYFNTSDNLKSYNLSLYSLEGRLIEQLNSLSSGTTYSFDLSNYSSGMYFLQLKSNNQLTASHKIIKL